VLLDCDGEWLLLDTGFNTALVTDPPGHDPIAWPALTAALAGDAVT
jgi:hypothetical protein